MHKLRQTGPLLLLFSALALLVLGGLILYYESLRPISIELDDQQILLNGRFNTVAEAIEDAGITLRPEDFIWPSPSAPPPVSAAIVIHTASPVELTIDGQTSTIWTLQENLASFLAENDIALSRTARISADGRAVTLSTLADTQPGRSVEISSHADIIVSTNHDSTPLYTQATTVGQAMVESGFEVYIADRVEPSMGKWLQPSQHIDVKRATPVTMDLDGRQFSTRTSREDVAGVLAELGVGLVGQDRPTPQLDRQLAENETISIERAGTTYELVETRLPFSSQLQPRADLEIDQRSLVATGSPGTLSQLARINLNATETPTRTIIGQWVSRPPTDEIIAYGTNVVLRTLATPEGTISYWRGVRMRVTAYTAADAGKPRSHPAYGITASGRPAGFGIAAVDPNVVPFRSQVYVPGYGVAFAGDTGGGVKGRWIDLGYNEGEIVAWNGYVDVYYLAPAPEPDRINYFIPTTLP